MTDIIIYSHELTKKVVVPPYQTLCITHVLTGVFHQHEVIIELEEGASVDYRMRLEAFKHGVMSITYRIARAARLEARAALQLDGRSQLTINSHQEHADPAGYSSVGYRVVVADSAVWHCTGSIYIAPHAHGVDAAFENPCLILEDGVVVTKPAIEVLAHKVRCKHGAASGRLDAEALMYLQRRGLSLQAARDLMIESFLLQ